MKFHTLEECLLVFEEKRSQSGVELRKYGKYSRDLFLVNVAYSEKKKDCLAIKFFTFWNVSIFLMKNDRC